MASIFEYSFHYSLDPIESIQLSADLQKEIGIEMCENFTILKARIAGRARLDDLGIDDIDRTLSSWNMAANLMTDIKFQTEINDVTRKLYEILGSKEN